MAECIYASMYAMCDLSTKVTLFFQISFRYLCNILHPTALQNSKRTLSPHSSKLCGRHIHIISAYFMVYIFPPASIHALLFRLVPLHQKLCCIPGDNAVAVIRAYTLKSALTDTPFRNELLHDGGGS